MTPRFIIFLTGGGFIAILLGCVTAAVLVLGMDMTLLDEPTAVPVMAQQATPRPTFTTTSTPLPPSPTSLFTSTPLPSPSPTETMIPLSPTETPVPTATPTPLPTATPPVAEAAAPAVVEPPPPESTGVDFVVAQQRMRSNAENSWEEVIANGCGSDHTIYVTVVDAAGNPIDGILVGDTYDNVRAVSGSAGVGKLEIVLWSNTMVLEVKRDVASDEALSSEQTVPLSAKDEDIPTEWLLEGGYCPSMAECDLRQNSNGLCRGHYSYDVVFQRSW